MSTRISPVFVLALSLLCANAWAQNNQKNQRATKTAPAAQAPSEGTESTPIITRKKLAATVDEDVLRGYQALSLNKFSEARAAYAAVLSRDGTQRDALLGMSYALQSLGDTPSALATLRRLFELYPRDSDAISALYLIGGGDPEEMESRLKQFLGRAERPAPLHYALGVLYFDQKRFGESANAFERAFSMDNQQPDYAYNYALALDRLGKGREAAKQYVVALNLANQASAVFSRESARTRLRVLTSEVPRPVSSTSPSP